MVFMGYMLGGPSWTFKQYLFSIIELFIAIPALVIDFFIYSDSICVKGTMSDKHLHCINIINFLVQFLIYSFLQSSIVVSPNCFISPLSEFCILSVIFSMAFNVCLFFTSYSFSHSCALMYISMLPVNARRAA